MRKGIQGLSRIIRDAFDADPTDGNLILDIKKLETQTSLWCSNTSKTLQPSERASTERFARLETKENHESALIVINSMSILRSQTSSSLVND